jgi:MFS family permease
VRAPPSPLRLRRWHDRAVVALTVFAFASGFGEFGAISALSSVARSFGQVVRGTTIADESGLSGTKIGIGLAILRLASLGGLGFAGLADRYGRRRMLLWTVTVGLGVTALAAASPSYWWFVAIFACGRPLLSATNGLAEVAASEETGNADRAKAVALVAGGYGVGAGVTAILHNLHVGGSGFRVLLLFALVPLLLVATVRRWIHEPDRYVVETEPHHALPVLGAVGHSFRRRLGVVALIAFALSLITGPANSFVFLYADDVVHQSGGLTAAMVALAAITGLAGLLLGRKLADTVGRRAAGAIGMIGLALFGVLTYAGSSVTLVLGYDLGVLAGSVLAPGVGALVNELFPTSVRASVTGWWIAAGVIGAVVGLLEFGALADVGNRFAFSAIVTFLPAAACAGAFFLLPETLGHDPEEQPGASETVN